MRGPSFPHFPPKEKPQELEQASGGEGKLTTITEKISLLWAKGNTVNFNLNKLPLQVILVTTKNSNVR